MWNGAECGVYDKGKGVEERVVVKYTEAAETYDGLVLRNILGEIYLVNTATDGGYIKCPPVIHISPQLFF